MSEYDPYDPRQLEDPYDTYAWLRAHDPVHHHVGAHAECFVLSRFADIWDAVRDPETFSSAQGLTFANERESLGLAPTIVMLDPPVHTRLRALIGAAFTPRRVAALEGAIREFARGRIARMQALAADGEPVDLHRDFASPIPSFVLGELLGVPDTDRPLFDPWVQVLTRLQNSGFAVDGLADAGDSVAAMYAYFSDLITRRRAEPTDDLLGALVAARLDGEGLTDWDILGFCFVLIAGGNDTTGNLISHAVMLLGAAPLQRDRVVADPSLVPNAVLECLRLESSVQALARTTTRPVTVRGVDIPADTKVLMVYGSGNRDEREFGPSAAELDIDRDIRRHLAFSSGPHFCVGSHFARLQATVALQELYRACPRIDVDTDAGQRLHSSFVRGWISLPAVDVLALSPR